MIDIIAIGRLAASISQGVTARMMAPIARRVRLMIARAVVTAIDDTGKIQTAQVKLLDGEVRDGIEILHQYGFTSIPHGKPESLYFSAGGDRDHGVMICVADRQFRLKSIAPGEVALYDDLDQKVHLTRDGIVVYTPLKCRVDAEHIELHANKSYSWDVHGYGQRITWLSGTEWEIKTWQQGATVIGVSLPINPPEGP